MIACSFCQSLRSQRYMYTECNHFVCMNCAALRAKEGILCCGILTKLSHQIKQELQLKKKQIMERVENGYQYEKVQVEEIDNLVNIKKNDQSHFGVILRKQKIDRRMATQQIEKEEQHMKYRLSLDEELKQTPIQGFYRSLKSNAQENQYKAQSAKNRSNDRNHLPVQNDKNLLRQQQISPIKLVSNLNQQEDYRSNSLVRRKNDIQNQQIKSNVNHQNEGKIQRRILQEKTKQVNLTEQIKVCFSQVLDHQFILVRKKFKQAHQSLQKLEAVVLYETKIYWEEYVKAIQKQFSFERVEELSIQIIQKEKNRMEKFLADNIQKRWSLQEICKLIEENLKSKGQPQNNRKDYHAGQINRQRTHENQNIESFFDRKTQATNKDTLKRQLRQDWTDIENSLNKVDKTKQISMKFPGFQEKASQPASNSHKDNSTFQQNVQPTLRLQNENNVRNSPNNNLQKIYKKLEESRTKLEERILVHSEFMNRKWDLNRVLTGR